MRKFLHIIQYHNIVPVILGVLFLGAGSAFAMSPEVRTAAAAAVLATENEVISIDNTYIANKDLEAYTPTAQITSVSEDEEHYYVDYNLTTISLQDHVWQDVVAEKTMKVSKADLGAYRDLGVYVTDQISQVVARERDYLREVQQFEKRNVSQKKVATKYGGLVGALLNDKTETIAGYQPVVTAKPPKEEWRRPVPEGRGNSGGGPDGKQNIAGSANVSGPLSLHPLGNNPAKINIRASYSDLGAVAVEDGKIANYSIKTLVDGKEVPFISIDTSTSTRYIITYRATNQDGNTAEATRAVLVGDAELGGVNITSSTFDIGTVTTKEQQNGKQTESQQKEETETETTNTEPETATSTSDGQSENTQEKTQATSTPEVEVVEEKMEEEGAEGTKAEEEETPATTTTPQQTDEDTGTPAEEPAEETEEPVQQETEEESTETNTTTATTTES